MELTKQTMINMQVKSKITSVVCNEDSELGLGSWYPHWNYILATNSWPKPLSLSNHT